VENARTGPLRARITRPALVIRWTLNGAGSGSPVGFLAAMCFQGKTDSGIRDTVSAWCDLPDTRAWDGCRLAKAAPKRSANGVARVAWSLRQGLPPRCTTQPTALKC
jgi:hypothetical protein